MAESGRTGDARVVTMHPGQLKVGLDTVRQLVDEQFPQWRSLPIEQVAVAGTVNALFRIGEHLAARFPLAPADLETTRRQLESEVRAARELLGRTRFPTPEPVAVGEPGAGYPLPWSVQTWLPGTTASHADPVDSVAFGHDLAEFIRGVRAIDTDGRTFSGSGRGGNLRDHNEWMEICFRNSKHLLDVPRLRRLWRAFRDLPPSPSVEVMTHGDLIPGNVLVCNGRLAGVIDVGGLGPADPALDLVGAWHLLQEAPRQSLRDELGSGHIEWERGKAWAFEQSMGAVWYYVHSNPPMSQMGMRTLTRILADTSV
jgi:aminoglycoside phosphotransferase (APT) family kinase protein